MSRQKKQVYAIIRIDSYKESIADQITVKEIVPTLEVAHAEVARLNELNKEKGCIYFWQATRFLAEESDESKALIISHDLIEEIRSFPLARETEHCGKKFSVRPFEIYARCPDCGERIKIRSFSGTAEVADIFDAVFEWASQTEAAEMVQERQKFLMEYNLGEQENAQG